MLNWQLNEHQEKFLNKLLAAQSCSKSVIKCVQQMQIVIKENEAEILKRTADKVKSLKIDQITDHETLYNAITEG